MGSSKTFLYGFFQMLYMNIKGLARLIGGHFCTWVVNVFNRGKKILARPC